MVGVQSLSQDHRKIPVSYLIPLPFFAKCYILITPQPHIFMGLFGKKNIQYSDCIGLLTENSWHKSFSMACLKAFHPQGRMYNRCYQSEGNIDWTILFFDSSAVFNCSTHCYFTSPLLCHSKICIYWKCSLEGKLSPLSCWSCWYLGPRGFLTFINCHSHGWCPDVLALDLKV